MRPNVSLSALVLSALSSSCALSLGLEHRQPYPQQMVKMTFYGYPDTHGDGNCSPPYVAHNCNNPDGTARNWLAGGDGSWGNPLSMAGNFKPCSIVYVPYLHKYGIIDDSCPPCAQDLLDVWVESGCYDDSGKVTQCEYDMTPADKQVVYYNIPFDQGSEQPVAKGPLYDSNSQTCSHQTF
ncbi:hypothetical protein F5B21DRAFT_506488 [Xylaria acuta]|nr:hypothetical protein F5B21DRAFT_506488 [Xylaria acuta]